MVIFKNINNILRDINSNHSHIPPTLLYNEGWMLRLILDWFSKHPNVSHPLSISAGCTWYSEALLSSPFLYGNKINEGYTHADGVAGMFNIGNVNKGELSLKADCNNFYVAEAKLGSPLSKGTKNAPTYNQAARNIACIADLLVNSQSTNNKFTKLAFYVIMPQICKHTEDTKLILEKKSIKDTISDRIKQFPAVENERESITWLRNNLDNYIDNQIEIELLFWEDIINYISDKDIIDFYKLCLKYNNL